MVGYILGDSVAKRRVCGAKSNAEEVYVDNSEVVAIVKNGDGCFYAIGDIPFSDMSVESYVAYSRALFDAQNMSNKRIRALLKKAGYKKKISQKMKTLDVFDFRRVQIASKIREDTKAIYINMDGVVYSKKAGKKLKKLIAHLKGFDTHVLVSDVAFVKYPATLTFVDGDMQSYAFPLDCVSSGVKVKKTAILKGEVGKGVRIRKAVKACAGKRR